MLNPELMGIIVLVTFAMVVVAADVLVRLVILPARKDKFIGALLDHLVEFDSETESARSLEAVALPAGDLQECLLRHFEKSKTSRQMLNELAECEGLTQRDLLSGLNRALAAKGKAPLPLAVARRVAMILLHAGLLKVENGVLEITNLGQTLNLLLETRKQASIAK